jgi:hypothetical protein
MNETGEHHDAGRQANEHSVSYFAAQEYCCCYYCRNRKRNFKRFASFFGITTTGSAPLPPSRWGADSPLRSKAGKRFSTFSVGRGPWLDPSLMITDEFALTIEVFMFAEK